MPAIVPVNYALLGSSVVFRTLSDGMLGRACRGAVTAFQVDELDPLGATGTSVFVVGVANPLTDSETIRALELGIVAAAGGPRDHFIGIPIAEVSGRRIGPGHHEPEQRGLQPAAW